MFAQQALEKKERAEKLLAELEEVQIPQQPEIDKEGITEEETSENASDKDCDGTDDHKTNSLSEQRMLRSTEAVIRRTRLKLSMVHFKYDP